MRTPIIALCTLLAVPATASARPIVWWHVGDNAVEDIPGGDDELREERRSVVGQELAIARRDQQIERRKQDKKEAKELRRAARKDLRQAKRDLRYADRNDNMGLRDAIDARATAERTLDETKDYVALQKARIHQARELKDHAKSRLSEEIARREYAEAFYVSIHDIKGEDWTVPNRYMRQIDRIHDEVLDDERELEMARVEVQEASQDHWSWDSAQAFATFFPVSPRPTIQISMESDQPDHELKRMHFELGDHHVMDEYKDELAHNAMVLRNHRDTKVRIEGHTDATGPEAFNLDLAWDRAEAVAASLRQMGVWDSQIQTVALGEGDPLVRTNDATAFNRRVEMRVVAPDNDAVVDGTVDDLDPDDVEGIEDRYRESMN